MNYKPPESHHRLTLRECLVQAVILLAIIVAIYPGTFFRGEMIFPGDLIYRYDPWKQHKPPDVEVPTNDSPFDVLTAFNPDWLLIGKALRAGEWPLWNHLEYSGMPLMANYQSGVFYPPRMFLGFVEHYWAVTIFMILRFWLCGATAYLCGRGLGLRVWPSRFLSIAWMIGGYNLLWAYWPLPDVAAWLPLLVVGVEWILRGWYRKGFFIFAPASALFLIGGHPETAFSMGLGLGLYFLLRLALDRRRGEGLWKPMAAVMGAWGAGIAIASVQLIPFFEYLVNSHTYLGRGEEALAIQYFRPTAMAAFWVPRFFGSYGDGSFWAWPADPALGDILSIYRPNSTWVSLVYSGVATWILLALLMKWRELPKTMRHRVLALAPVCVFELILATKAPIFNFIHQMPPFNVMWPAYHVAFVTFAVPLLGAFGMEYWFSRDRNPKELLRSAPMFAIAAIVLVFAYAAHRDAIQQEQVLGYIARQIALFAVLSTVVLLLLAAYSRWSRAEIFAGLVTVVLAVDLLVAGRGINYTMPRERIFPDTEFTRTMQNLEPPGRISTVGTDFAPGFTQAFGLEQLWGHDGIIPHRMMEYIFTLNPCNWATMEPVASVPYYLFREASVPALRDDPKFELLGVSEGYGVFRNRHAFPRAFLVPRVEAVETEDGLFARMCAENFDPRALAVTEKPPDGNLPEGAGYASGKVRVIERGMHRAVIEVVAEHDAVLVLTDAYFPGWKAYVDGVEAPIFPVYYAFRGVVVSAGGHTVEFKYEPASFTGGLTLSTVALLTCAVLGVALLVRSSRNSRAGR